MGIFDRFKKPAQNGSSQTDLSSFCYQTAYFVLPQILFADAERTIGYFTRNEYPSGPYLYALAAKALKVEGSREGALSFQTHVAEVKEGIEGYILEYPKPSPVDLGSGNVVLAPFFSSIVKNHATAAVAYYVLGQRPTGGTTFRSVTPDGANSNMGPGPEPELPAFLEFLREKL